MTQRPLALSRITDSHVASAVDHLKPFRRSPKKVGLWPVDDCRVWSAATEIVAAQLRRLPTRNCLL